LRKELDEFPVAAPFEPFSDVGSDRLHRASDLGDKGKIRGEWLSPGESVNRLL
jgi:hypothetical protein